jgi:2,4-dienoyl-CoA reductase-like NADH-dependent reductase (Old Yellow Enzyme family)
MGSSDNVETFTYLANALSHYPLAYLHVMDGQGFGSVNHLCRPLTLYEMKKAFEEGPIMADVAFTKETAEGVLRSGAADLIAFGRPFISNPDLVDRFTNDWPLAPDADQKEWWTAPEKEEDIPKGYLTYLPFQPPLTSMQP